VLDRHPDAFEQVTEPAHGDSGIFSAYLLLANPVRAMECRGIIIADLQFPARAGAADRKASQMHAV
jgi:hypothetical protein